jgi:hypothetical protein
MFHKKAVGFAGIGKVAVFYFFGKGMGYQPVKQFHIQPQAPVDKLRGVGMQINQTGNNEFAAAAGKGQTGVLLRQLFKNAGGFSPAADQKGIRPDFKGMGTSAPANITLYNKIFAVPDGRIGMHHSLQEYSI